MNREQLINEIIETQLELCQRSVEYNDGFIYEVMRYGSIGLENMIKGRLIDELKYLQGA